MSAKTIILALDLIRVTSPDGAPADLNPNEIVYIRAPRENEQRTFHQHVGCVIFTADGKFVATYEKCQEIRQKIDSYNREKPP